jgi:antitoxin FitA
MATLYVNNVPDDRYEALRARAKANRRSIAAEVMTLLEQFVPTEAELERRHKAFRHAVKAMSSKPPANGPFPTAEEMVREDRER